MAKNKKKGVKKNNSSNISNTNDISDYANNGIVETVVKDIPIVSDMIEKTNDTIETELLQLEDEVEIGEQEEIQEAEIAEDDDNEGKGVMETVESAYNGTSVVEILKKQIVDLKSELVQARESMFSDSTESNTSSELEQAKKERDDFEKQYNSLLDRISSMKTLFSKMKESQRDLESSQELLSEYESQNLKLKSKLESITKENKELESTVVTLNQEYASLEKEVEEYQDKLHEMDSTSSSLTSHTYELEMLNREIESLKTQAQEMTILLDNNKDDINNLKEEKEDLKSSLSTFQRENADLQNDLNKLEIEMKKFIKNNEDALQAKQQEIDYLRVQLDGSEEKLTESSISIEELSNQITKLNKSVEIWKEIEAKNHDLVTQAGKLRHENVVVNEHLSKALAMIKKSSDSDTVDKELISNLIISFVTLPRADTRKFEVLELISSCLTWDEDKQEQAGLIHGMNMNGAQPAKKASRTQTFISKWTDFLERESEVEK